MSDPKEFEQHSMDDQGAPPAGMDVGQDWESTPNVIYTDKTLIVKNKATFNEREFNLQYGQKVRRTAISGNYTLAYDDYYIGVTSLATAPTITLPKPSIAGIGKSFVIKDETGGAGSTTITISQFATDLIDGAATKTITTNYGSVKVLTNGKDWFII